MNDDIATNDSLGASDYRPDPTSTSLSDEALQAAGLAKIYAFVRSEASTNALRARKAREKAASDGNGQVNVVVPLAAHRLIKTMAKDLQRGVPIAEVLTEVLATELRAVNPNDVVRVKSAERAREAESLATRIAALRGWRLLLARMLGLL